jgi:uncharacterized protein YjiS (DUF1127 family)
MRSPGILLGDEITDILSVKNRDEKKKRSDRRIARVPSNPPQNREIGDFNMAALVRALTNGQNVFAVAAEKMVGTFGTWQQRIEARNELAELTLRDIQDIGLDQAEVEREIAKPFWRA